MSNISNIDELLMGVGNSQQPETPEHKEKIEEEKIPIESEDIEVAYDSDLLPNDNDDSDNDTSDNIKKPTDNEKLEEKETEVELDDYGNEKESMPKGLKDRLDRKEKQFQQELAQRDLELQRLREQLASKGASKEVQQAVKDFEYNPNDDVSWEQQLSEFVKQTVSNMQNEEQQKARQIREQKIQQEFEQKFVKGMDRFNDFREVVSNQPIDDAMTLALRGMTDPAAFIYAASKRQPEELQRIAKLSDPYARMVEMGKLEERMRRHKSATKAPRPLGRLKEDTTERVTPKQKDMTGDDLLAKADANRLAIVRNRHIKNR